MGADTASQAEAWNGSTVRISFCIERTPELIKEDKEKRVLFSGRAITTDLNSLTLRTWELQFQ